ncbi:MAG: DNA polymerase III subunit gamma/tau [Dehalococcoidia bacterium]|nr:DNA polymerase III subunit gamma/tau [Dehalococcoidia bacterium]
MKGTQVFYRKWRPQRFDDVSGQEHVTLTLRKAVTTGRVAHAYLFTGPRGVGKTSSARILAKALNCLSPKEGEPDNTCANCQAALEDRMLDLIEIDAASNRGIDDIRKLRDNTAFSPISGGWKVYIIDEVHMLTEQAANALLKTLEEPPPRIVMVLATTDVHKVPLTIVSRCQRYDFRRLSNEDVIDRLAGICGAEEIECDPEVLNMIARHAWGSLRDAENLLEQLAVSYGGASSQAEGSEPGRQSTEIKPEHVRELLGLGDTASAIELAGALLAGDAGRSLGVINREAGRGTDLRGLRNATVDALRCALLQKAGVQDALAHPAEVVEAMKTAGRPVSMDRLLHTLSVIGQADIKGDSSSPLPFELAVLRATSAATAPATVTTSTPPAPAPAQRPPAGAPAPSRFGRPPGQSPQPYAPSTGASRTTVTAPMNRGPAPSAGPDLDEPSPSSRQPASPADQKWTRVTNTLRRTKFRKFVIGPLLTGARVNEPEGGTLLLHIASKTLRQNVAEEFQDQRVMDAVEKAVAEVYGLPLKIAIALSDANGGAAGQAGGASAASESPVVRAALAMGARVIGEEDAPEPQ